MIPIHVSKSSLFKVHFYISPYLQIVLQSNIILSGVPIRTLYGFLFSLIHEMCSNHLILLDMNVVMMLGTNTNRDIPHC